MKKTVLYLRVSTSEQDLEPQRMALKHACALKGWKIDAEYSDVISGARDSRLGLNALLAACEAGLIARVLTLKIDRVSRSLSDFVVLVDKFIAMDVALICPGQGIDTSSETPEGKFFRNIFAAFAEFERELIRARTRDGLAVARARGKVLGRPSVKLVENWREVLEMWRPSGNSYSALADALGGVAKSTAWNIANEKNEFRK